MRAGGGEGSSRGTKYTAVMELYNSKYEQTNFAIEMEGEGRTENCGKGCERAYACVGISVCAKTVKWELSIRVHPNKP